MIDNNITTYVGNYFHRQRRSHYIVTYCNVRYYNTHTVVRRPQYYHIIVYTQTPSYLHFVYIQGDILDPSTF